MMTQQHIPNEVMRNIYEYDPTFRQKYRSCIKKIVSHKHEILNRMGGTYKQISDDVFICDTHTYIVLTIDEVKLLLKLSIQQNIDNLNEMVISSCLNHLNIDSKLDLIRNAKKNNTCKNVISDLLNYDKLIDYLYLDKSMYNTLKLWKTYYFDGYYEDTLKVESEYMDYYIFVIEND